MTPLVIRAGAQTDVGRVREHNEDNFVVEDRLFAVADGMGGHAAGEVASAIAVDIVGDVVENDPIRPDDLKNALSDAHERILGSVDDHPERRGMGTTMTGVAVVSAFGSDHWAVFNVGDSRVYRVVDGRLHQVTVDHSEIQELLSAGLITEAEARVHPGRNVITRSLGMSYPMEPDLWVFPPAEEEIFLICSDGLTNEVSESDIAVILEAEDDPQAAADRLVHEARLGGGRDNITVIVVHSRSDADDDERHDTAPRLGAAGPEGEDR
ncbi:MAG: Stp1/IreP family PP2C-type Ser/Thr phosphatase [Intrasporangiaceae bacterium]|nr:Stp1/IreP family PP2C-type Ser/Thr phosphatase [Intrasporangiaceae bacterium]